MYTKSLLFNLHDNHALAAALGSQLGMVSARLETRHFPDGESYFRVLDNVDGCRAIILADLYQPDQHTLAVLLLADTLRDLGATSIVLVAPYLPYMRQDKRFHTGEGVTSRYFARILSGQVDGLVTVDPHLHRYAQLNEIYSIPCAVMHAAENIAQWITGNVNQPVLIGPDAESEQWVAAVAEHTGAPYTVLEKVRRDDRDVAVSVPDVERWRAHTPVLVDDIISSGHTMLQTLEHLRRLGLRRAVCIGVHAVFAEDAAQQLAAAAARVVTSNAIPHTSNSIDISNLLASGVDDLLRSALTR